MPVASFQDLTLPIIPRCHDGTGNSPQKCATICLWRLRLCSCRFPSRMGRPAAALSRGKPTGSSFFPPDRPPPAARGVFSEVTDGRFCQKRRLFVSSDHAKCCGTGALGAVDNTPGISGKGHYGGRGQAIVKFACPGGKSNRNLSTDLERNCHCSRELPGCSNVDNVDW